MTIDETTIRQLIETAVEAYEINGVTDKTRFVSFTLHEAWFAKAKELLNEDEEEETKDWYGSIKQNH